MKPLPRGEIWCCCVEDWQAPAVFYSSRIPSLEERRAIRDLMMPNDLVSYDPASSPTIGGRPVAILRNQAERDGEYEYARELDRDMWPFERFPERWVLCTPEVTRLCTSNFRVTPRAGGEEDGA